MHVLEFAGPDRLGLQHLVLVAGRGIEAAVSGQLGGAVLVVPLVEARRPVRVAVDELGVAAVVGLGHQRDARVDQRAERVGVVVDADRGADRGTRAEAQISMYQRYASFHRFSCSKQRAMLNATLRFFTSRFEARNSPSASSTLPSRYSVAARRKRKSASSATESARAGAAQSSAATRQRLRIGERLPRGQGSWHAASASTHWPDEGSQAWLAH